MKPLPTPRAQMLSESAERVLRPLALAANGPSSAVPLRRNPAAVSEQMGAVPSYGRIGSVDLSSIPPLEACNPGFAPTEYNVLVVPPDKAEKSQGGVIFSDETKDADFMGAQLGRLVALSPIAFNYDDAWTKDMQPKLGDVVWFARYAGGVFTGLDGREYRLIKDRDVGGVIAP